MSGQTRNDVQVDALIRRLDVEQDPSREFVDETYGLLRAHAEEARRRDASAFGRLLTALPRPALSTPRHLAVWRPALGLVLVMLALLVWLALIVAGPGLPPPRLADHVVFGRGHAGGYDLWIVGKDGSDEHLLAAGMNEPGRVSPDGTRIAVPYHGELVFTRIYRSDGSTLVDLQPDATLNLGVIAWSHDGRWLAAEAWDETNPDRNGMYLMRSDGTGLHRLTGSGVPGDFSLDDRQVVITRQEGLFVVNVDGTNEHQIGALKPVAYAPPGYMPDGRSIYAAAEGKIWIIDLATGGTRSLEVSGGDISVPRISPDGRTFVFTFDAASADTTAIWVMNVDGSDPHMLVDDPTANEDFSDWLP